VSRRSYFPYTRSFSGSPVSVSAACRSRVQKSQTIIRRKDKTGSPSLCVSFYNARDRTAPWPFPADVIYRAVKNFTVFCARRSFVRTHGKDEVERRRVRCYSCYLPARLVFLLRYLLRFVRCYYHVATSRFSVTCLFISLSLCVVYRTRVYTHVFTRSRTGLNDIFNSPRRVIRCTYVLYCNV